MAMTIAGAVAALKTRIESVPGTGKVYNRRRPMGSLDEIRAILADDDGLVNGGFITVESLPSATRQNAQYLVGRLVLRYESFYGFRDSTESEIAHRDLVFAVFLAVNASLFYTGAGVSNQEAMVIRQFGGFESDGGVYLHYADLSVGIEGRFLPA